MEKPVVVLASQSQRRRELLALTLLPFETLSVETDERFDADLSTEENVIRIAERKATAALLVEQRTNAIILAADTVVARNGHVFGKPANAEEAVAMLKSLQDSSHQVYTGFVLVKGKERYRECVSTTVEFDAMPDDEIRRYVEILEPFDKAGAYGIQDPLLACHVRRIEGCYYNVVGLPLSRVWRALGLFL